MPNIKASAIDTGITTWKTWRSQNCADTQFTADQELVDINGNTIITPVSNGKSSKAMANPQKMVEIIKEIHEIDENENDRKNVITDDKNIIISLDGLDQITDLIKVFLLFCGVLIFVVIYAVKSCKSFKSFGMDREKYSKVAHFDCGSESENV